ncbi:hypothetical protein N9L91_01250 [Pseudomonadales bacterium]|nr:hypothetical protein [Pseudomonadales bacterium]
MLKCAALLLIISTIVFFTELSMRLLAIGVNHSTANVELRERLAFAPDAMQTALSSLLACLSMSDDMPDDMSDDSPSESAAEAVIVSTCNRTELIVSTGYNAEAVIAWLAEFKSLPIEQFSEHIYIHEDQEALRHLIRVAGGLDSMILGEPQIFWPNEILLCRLTPS